MAKYEVPSQHLSEGPEINYE